MWNRSAKLGPVTEMNYLVEDSDEENIDALAVVDTERRVEKLLDKAKLPASEVLEKKKAEAEEAIARHEPYEKWMPDDQAIEPADRGTATN